MASVACTRYVKERWGDGEERIACASDTEILSNRGTRMGCAHVLRSILVGRGSGPEARRDGSTTEFHSTGFRQPVTIDLLIDRP